MEFTPILPRDSQGKIFENLIIKAEQVILKSETLNCVHTSQTISAISKMLYTVNSYYSNQIESEGTHPINIEKAMKKEYSKDSKERALQTLSINYIETQKMLYSKVNDTSAFVLETILLTHKFLYSQKGMESFLEIKSDDETIIQMRPGALRDREVRVGIHIPPNASSLLGLLTQMLDLYVIENKGTLTKRLILALAFHHKLTWIHPFLDGNGRVSRLILDLSLKQLLGKAMGYGT